MQSFEMIAERIQDILPQGWKKVVFYAEVTDDSYEMFYYVFTSESDKPIQCYDLPDLYEIDENQIDAIFEELYEPLRKERSSLIAEGKEPWSNYTLILNSDSSFKVDYDFTSLEDGGYEYRKQWKNKYIIDTSDKS
jgi:hypothetical protein